MSDQDDFIMVGKQRVRKSRKGFVRNAQNILDNSYYDPNQSLQAQNNLPNIDNSGFSQTPSPYANLYNSSLAPPAPPPPRIHSAASSNQSIDDLYFEAINQMRIGKYREAEKMLFKFVSQSESNAQKSKGRCALGQLMQAQKDDSSAMEYYNLCLVDDPKNEIAHVNFASILISRKTNLLSSIDHLQQCLKTNNKNSEAHYNLSYIYIYLQQNMSKAEVHLQNFTKLLPNDPRGYRLLHIACMEQDKVEKAREALQRAINIRPIESDYYNMGKLYLDQNYLNEAQQFFNKCLTINPSHFQALLSLGVVFVLKKQLPEALESYQKALALKSNSFEALSNLGNVHFQQQEFQKAQDFYKKAQAIDNQEPHLQLNLGRTQYELREYDSAIQNLQECFQKNQKLFYALKLIAIINLENQKAIPSIQSSEKYLEYEQNDSQAYYVLAQAQFLIFQYSKAQKSIQYCLALSPNHEEALELQEQVTKAIR